MLSLIRRARGPPKEQDVEWRRADSWNLLVPSCLSIAASNHDDLQRVMAAALFCLPNLMQIPLLAKSNSEPYREEDSGELRSSLTRVFSTNHHVSNFENAVIRSS